MNRDSWYRHRYKSLSIPEADLWSVWPGINNLLLQELEKNKHTLKLQQEQTWHDLQMKMAKERQAIEMDKMNKLKQMGVDLGELLVAKEKVPDKFYRVEGANGKPNENVQLHLHEDGLRQRPV